jgi:hypothetical protein
MENHKAATQLGSVFKTTLGFWGLIAQPDHYVARITRVIYPTTYYITYINLLLKCVLHLTERQAKEN